MELDQEILEHEVHKKDLGFYVSLGTKLQDVLVLSNVRTADPGLQAQSQVRFTLTPETRDKVTIVVKTVKDSGRDSIKLGSISISQELFVSSGDSKHVQWITLFDHLDDDEYDGDFTECDEELP